MEDLVFQEASLGANYLLLPSSGLRVLIVVVHTNREDTPFIHHQKLVGPVKLSTWVRGSILSCGVDCRDSYQKKKKKKRKKKRHH